MKTVRCLIIDDEPLARAGLRRLLAAFADIEVVGEAGSAREALEAITRLKPDLLTLDIDMPGGHGFDVLTALSEPPAVIFVTAYDQHALRAFEVNAIDYVLKPVDPERLERALIRALDRLRGESDASGVGHPLKQTDSALVEIGRSGHFVAVEHILLLAAEGNYCRVTVQGGKNYVVRQTLRDWVRRLPPELFVQLDRGLVLNQAQIRDVRFGWRTAQVTLGDLPESLALGMAAADRLRQVLGKPPA